MSGGVFILIVFALMVYFLPALTAIKRGVEHPSAQRMP
jgi:hypothetical protein